MKWGVPTTGPGTAGEQCHRLHRLGGNWDEATRIYKTGLTYFPEDRHLQDNLQTCLERKGKGK